jgi:hypothetical protein
MVEEAFKKAFVELETGRMLIEKLICGIEELMKYWTCLFDFRGFFITNTGFRGCRDLLHVRSSSVVRLQFTIRIDHRVSAVVVFIEEAFCTEECILQRMPCSTVVAKSRPVLSPPIRSFSMTNHFSLLRTRSMPEHVTKGEPILFHQNNEAFHCPVIWI